MTASRKFDPAKRKKLNNPIRLQWLPPARIWQLVSAENGTEYIDIGAGTGYLTTHIAQEATSPIRVHALDIEPLMITEMEQTLPTDTTIMTRLMEHNKLPFADNSIDGIWLITLFHEVTPPDLLLKEIQRVLRPDHTMVIVDWQKKQEDCDQGPPFEHRVSLQTALDQVAAAGFHAVQEQSEFQHHFCITACS